MRCLVIARAGYGNPRRGIEHVPAGGIVDVPETLAAHLIATHILAPAPAPKVETTAVAAPKQTTAKRVSKPAKARAEEEDRASKEQAE